MFIFFWCTPFSIDFQSRHGSQQTLGSGNIMASRTTVFSAQILSQGKQQSDTQSVTVPLKLSILI